MTNDDAPSEWLLDERRLRVEARLEQIRAMLPPPTVYSRDALSFRERDALDLLVAVRGALAAVDDLMRRGQSLEDRRGGNGSIVAQRDAGRGEGYLQAARQIADAIYEPLKEGR